jgi:hypothetical protein
MAGKRKILTLEQRVDVLKKFDAGVSCRAIALQLGCGKTQIAAIRVDKANVLRDWEAGCSANIKIKKRKTVYEELNCFVWEWFCTARSKQLPVSGRLIQEKARMLAVSLGHNDFTASNGWLEAWQRRFSVRLATLCGEAAAVCEDVVADWKKRLATITDGYDLADIYNADETGLYFRALSNRSMIVRDDPRKGIKTSKERITVLLACSAAGEKLKPLVIGKAENPRCFRGVDKTSLPVTYRANKKAWMTSALFKEWLERLNGTMKLQQRSILLFIDNAGPHPDMQLSNIKLVFLPPNTTSRLQPCDAGIIANVKALYRTDLSRHLLAVMDDANSAADLAKRVNIIDAISWLHTAWSSVSEECIRKCFARCGFRPDDAEVALVEPAVEPDEAIQVLLGDVAWQDYVAMDDAIYTSAVYDDDWEAALVAKARGQTVTEDVDESGGSGEEEEEDPPEVITSRVALDNMKGLVKYALSSSDRQLFDAAASMQKLLEMHCIRKATSAPQKTMKDFFGQ